MTAEGPGEGPSAPAGDPATGIPRLAAGVERVGRYEGSGSAEPGYLLKRGDGSMLAVSCLLYSLTGVIDGRRTPSEIADRLSAGSRCSIDADGVVFLVDEKLGPLGVTVHGLHRAAPAAPVLGVAGRTVLVSAHAVRPAAAVLRHLFHPPVVLAVVLLAIAAHLQLFFAPVSLDPGLLSGRPGVLLAIVGLTLAGALFHEFGHASAGVYSGAEPGPIGAGVLIIWPAFYTDLTDSYRLDRRGRIRTDLGGIYFNLLLVALFGGAYAYTGNPMWAWALLAQDVIIVQQFLPFLRLDGYYLVSDMLGVPDLFARVRPFMRSLRPGNRTASPRTALADLRPRVRAAVGAWIIGTVAILGFFAAWLALRLPQIVETLGSLSAAGWYTASLLLRAGDYPEGAVALIGAALISVQLFGLAVVLFRVARRLGNAVASVAARVG